MSFDARKNLWLRLARRLCERVVSSVLCAAGCLLPLTANRLIADESSGTAAALISLAELKQTVVTQGRTITSFRAEGVVCAADSATRRVIVQDDSATLLIKLPFFDEQVRSGARLEIEANHCAMTRGLFGVCIGSLPVVDVDGVHPAISRSGTVFLEAGMQPLRLEWFNFDNEYSLAVSFRGPGLSRQNIPSAELWRPAKLDSGETNLVQGLVYTQYDGAKWNALPKFDELTPVARGTTTNFNVDVRTQRDHVGLVFSGYLKVPTTGVYTFFLDSDDGCRLWVGDPASACQLFVPTNREVPAAKTMAWVLGGGDNDQWTAVAGEVRFASRTGDQLNLEVLDGNVVVPVTLLNAGKLNAAPLLHQRVRVLGVCQFTPALNQKRAPRLVALNADSLTVLDAPRSVNGGDVLTSAEQVRALQPDQARKHLRVELRGVVTTANFWSFVLRDTSGGVFVQFSATGWINQPRVGEVWEIRGTTDPGDFSPVVRATRGTCLGNMGLPEPIHPTWEQLMNGSVDAELIEVQGVITAWSPFEIALLTRDGKLRLLSKANYPLPTLPPDVASPDELLGGLVRLRGVFAANWDWTTYRLRPGEFYLGDASLCVDEFAPEDPFSIPTRHATDPLLFTSHVGALTRLKVSGHVLYASPGEYLLLDASNGVRVLTTKPLPLREGDLVEAVGFPQLGGPSPVLQEAMARKIGSASRPVPVVVKAETLSDRSLDSTLVQVDAVLLSDSVRQGERILELQAGPSHFLARLRGVPSARSAIRRGSQLRLTGVYSGALPERPGNDLDAFEILLTRPADLVILRSGPWWTVRHTVITIAILFSGLAVALVWIGLLRRTVAQRTMQLEREIEERQATEHRRAMEQERSRVAQDLHDDLGAGLAQIGWIGALAQRQSTPPERAKEYLAEITNKSNEMVGALDEIVWAVNPRHDSTGAVTGYLCDYAQEFFRATGVSCRFEAGRQHPEVVLNSTQRHQLFLAFKEALTNVVKHAQASEVWIRIGVNDGELGVAVEDNGRGLPANGSVSNGHGNGLTNMSERLKQIGGRCEIERRSPGGTVVRFQIRLPQHLS